MASELLVAALMQALVAVEPIAPRAEAEPQVMTVTLDQAIAQAVEKNPRLAQALSIAERAEASAVAARSQWLPTAFLNAGFTQLDANRVLADRVLVPATTLAANLSIQMPLLAINRWLASGQAEAALKAEQLGAHDIRRLVTGLVARAWFQVRLQSQLVEVADRAVQTSTRQLELATVRGQGGLGTRLDVLRASRELKDNENRRSQSRADLIAAKETLGAVMGLEVPAQAAGEPGLPSAPLTNEVPTLVRERDDVKAAQGRVEVAERRVNESWTDYLPLVVGGFTPFVQTPATPTQPNVGFTATATLSQPLYDGSARSALYRDRRASLHLAEGQRDELLQRALADARTALAQVTERERGAAAASESASLAAEALQLAQLSYEQGAGTSIELVDAERSARDAATNASTAQVVSELARVDLLVATGRWSPAK